MLKNYVSTHSFVKTNDLFICICKYDIKRRGNGSTIAPPKQQNCRDIISHIMVNTFMPFLRNTFCMFMALWDHRQYVDFGLKIEFRSCAGAGGVAYFITTDEQLQINRGCYLSHTRYGFVRLSFLSD